MNVLDLDRPSTWLPHLSSIVYKSATWSAIENEISDPLKESTFKFELKKSSEYQSHPLIKELLRKVDLTLLKKYTHVTGYHGCRPKSLSSYKKFGLLPSNIEKLKAEAKILFRGIPNFDAALKGIGIDYEEHNNGKIWLLLSKKWALSVDSSHSQGSEFMQTLADRLGPEAKKRFSRTGKCTWIKAIIPTEWLDTHTTFPVREKYVLNVISGLIHSKKWPEVKLDFFEGGYALKKAIPPQDILKFYGHRKTRKF